MRRLSLITLAGLAFLSSCQGLETKNEVFRLRGSYNNEFYKRHPKDFQLTTVAHWAHGNISDVLLSQPNDSAKADRDFYSKSQWFLKHPAKTEPHQTYVGPEFARLAWRAVHVIDWTHQLHEQLYDVMTDSRISPANKKKWIDRAVDYYLSEPDIAFSPATFEEVIMKRVGLMKQPWFKSFRHRFPKTMDLFRAFHWWHPVVYEAQLLHPKLAPQKEAVLKIDELFLEQVIPNPPNRMLLSREVMPRFSMLTPEAANIFDNLHMFHGIIYDVLASPKVKDKRREIYRMIDLMTVKPGDRKIAGNFPIPDPDLDPLVYPESMWKGHGEMGRIMGHTMHHPMKG